MPRRHDEAQRVGPDLLVLRPRQIDALKTGPVAALAHEHDRVGLRGLVVLGPLAHPLVDGPERRLILGNPCLATLHGRGIPGAATVQWSRGEAIWLGADLDAADAVLASARLGTRISMAPSRS